MSGSVSRHFDETARGQETWINELDFMDLNCLRKLLDNTRRLRMVEDNRGPERRFCDLLA